MSIGARRQTAIVPRDFLLAVALQRRGDTFAGIFLGSPVFEPALKTRVFPRSQRIDSALFLWGLVTICWKTGRAPAILLTPVLLPAEGGGVFVGSALIDF